MFGKSRRGEKAAQGPGMKQQRELPDPCSGAAVADRTGPSVVQGSRLVFAAGLARGRSPLQAMSQTGCP